MNPILLLISLSFGGVIFWVLVALGWWVDRGAQIRVRYRLGWGEDQQRSRRRDDFTRLLDEILPPQVIKRFADQELVIQSGIRMSSERYQALWWLIFMAGAVVGLLMIVSRFEYLGGWVTALGMLLFSGFGPYLYLHWRKQERTRAVTRNLPDFLDLLTLTVEAGLGFIPALRRLSKGYSGVLEVELQKTLLDIDLGYSRREALQMMSARIPSTEVAHFVEAINLSERLGTSLARTLRDQSNLLRTRRRQRAEAKAQTAPIRIIPALVFFFLPSLLLVYLAPPIINFFFQR